MEQCKLDRLSELTQISRQRELTVEETEERCILREEYLVEWRLGTKATLDRIYIVDENGEQRKLTKD